MGIPALTQLVPIQELTPGQVGAIRNSVIKFTVEKAAREMNMSEDKLVVRDIRPFADLQMYQQTLGTAKTVETWTYNCTSTATGYESITGTANMADQRYLAIYGVRDFRLGLDTHATASAPLITLQWPSYVSLIKINVGGADKVIWDTKCMQTYKENLVAFAPAAVIIPQNTSYNISFYKTRATGGNIYIQLIGVIVEPRGKVIAP